MFQRYCFNFTRYNQESRKMSIPKRPFSSGSREAPDPIDQFLMQAGFYRKHTARDASSLFRCVSEYIFDGQYGHEQVRADCVEYMSKNRDIYEEVSFFFNLNQNYNN